MSRDELGGRQADRQTGAQSWAALGKPDQTGRAELEQWTDSRTAGLLRETSEDRTGQDNGRA